MELRQLKYFASVARQQSFGKAAAELNVAQPALSRQIARLESELGVKLFARHARGARPTKEAQFLLERVEFGLQFFEQTRRELLAQRNSVGGPVVLGLQESFAEALGPALLEECRAAFPDIQLRFNGGLSPALREALLAGEADLAVLTEPIGPGNLHVEALPTEPLYLIGVPGSLADGVGEVRLPQLSSLPMILTGQARHGVRHVVESAAREAGVRFDVVGEVASMVVARRMIEHGLGYTISIRRTVMPEIERGLLAVRRVEGLALRRFVCRNAAFPPSRAIHEVQRMLLRIARAALPEE